MFRIILAILFCLTVSFSKEYSLNELIDSAYKHSHLLIIADAQIERNRDFVDESRRNLLPKIKFDGNYSYAVTPYNSMGENMGEIPLFTETYNAYIFTRSPWRDGDTLITSMLDYMMYGFTMPPPRNTLSGGIDIRQTFFAQNRIRYSILYARLQGRALICNWQDVRMRVKANMTRLYYSGLIAKEQVSIEEQSSNIAESRHKQNVVRFNSHILSEIDTLNSFIDYTSSLIRLAESQRHGREIYRTIATAAGIKENPDSIILNDSLELSTYIFNYDILEQHFLSENKDLRILANEVDLAELRVKMARGDYYPIVYGGISFNRIAQYEDLKRFDDFEFIPDRKLYLGISYDITTFGQRKLKLKQSEYDLKIAKHNYENKKEQLLIRLRTNYEALEQEHAKVEESGKILKAARKALDLAQNRMRDGLISQTEMDIFEQRFRQSGLVHLSAISQYNSALIDLRIMGADYLYEFSEQ